MLLQRFYLSGSTFVHLPIHKICFHISIVSFVLKEVFQEYPDLFIYHSYLLHRMQIN